MRVQINGDVTELADRYGNPVAMYTYDPWGAVTSVTDANGNDVSADPTHIANINPIRYRGYYYDTETGFYFLQSRYYDPQTHRFINADSVVSDVGGNTLGYNLYAYCRNNPINMVDDNGNWPKWVEKATKIASAVLVVAAVATVVVTVSAFSAGTGSAAAVILEKYADELLCQCEIIMNDRSRKKEVKRMVELFKLRSATNRSSVVQKSYEQVQSDCCRWKKISDIANKM